MQPKFLTLAEILEFHEDLLRSFGGSPGIRDLGLLESAVAMPQSGSGNVFFHQFPFEMAASYAFHIAQNHAFVDGNKRTALTAALVFLEINEHPVRAARKSLRQPPERSPRGRWTRVFLQKCLRKPTSCIKAGLRTLHV